MWEHCEGRLASCLAFYTPFCRSSANADYIYRAVISPVCIPSTDKVATEEGKKKTSCSEASIFFFFCIPPFRQFVITNFRPRSFCAPRRYDFPGTGIRDSAVVKYKPPW